MRNIEVKNSKNNQTESVNSEFNTEPEIDLNSEFERDYDYNPFPSIEEIVNQINLTGSIGGSRAGIDTNAPEHHQPKTGTPRLTKKGFLKGL